MNCDAVTKPAPVDAVRRVVLRRRGTRAAAPGCLRQLAGARLERTQALHESIDCAEVGTRSGLTRGLPAQSSYRDERLGRERRTTPQHRGRSLPVACHLRFRLELVR